MYIPIANIYRLPYLDNSVYSISYVDIPQHPVYPGDFRCYSYSAMLLNCVRFNYGIIYSPSSVVGIYCTTALRTLLLWIV